MNNRITLVFGAGGTAGHINPALAIADAFKHKYPETKIVFVGTADRMERVLVPEAGYPFVPISASPLPSSLSVLELKKIKKIITGLADSKSLLRTLEPAVVVGTGGYVCAPLLRQANKMKIPTLLHEQNAIAGKSNKMLAKKASVVCTASPNMAHQFAHPERVVLTGNPLRQEFLLKHDCCSARQMLGYKSNEIIIMVMGGSLGAATLNRAVVEFARQYCNQKNQQNVRILVSTGKTEFEHLKTELAEYPFVEVKAYFDQVAMQMAAADVVVARAGAITCAEIAAAGAASVLVPYPLAIYDHQTQNAKALSDKGGARLIADSEFNGTKLEEILAQIKEDPDYFAKMRKTASALALTEACDLIVKEIAKLAKMQV